MSLASRLQYYRRIFGAYLGPGQSQLTFWHETPQANPNAGPDALGEYYMTFAEKADYSGHYDFAGIPMLDYHGQIGLQYNPIAIAQWGLGNYNLFRRTAEQERKQKFLAASDWLCAHLEQNPFGIWVWNHHFDWEYRTPLRAPWYSGLAQGQGISLLVRAYQETRNRSYLEAAERAFGSFLKPTDQGGVIFTDNHGDLWIEEYIVSPPTHILNGFIWAAWGVYDYYLATRNGSARELFAKAAQTLRANLDRYDLGFWSLYEQSGTRLPMVASSFYHQLHVVQLRIMYRLTGDEFFARYADRWENYGRSRAKRTRALCYKGAFKLCYY
jgi:heparosan-N-sulfate-glucuronate 5-epimerase